MNLKKGSKGEQVKEVQNLLTKLKHYDGKVDGDYGNLTVTAVKKYQKQAGLKEDGIFGPITCKKIQANNTTTTTTKKTETTSNKEHTIFTNTKLCERTGGDCLGQTNSYRCGPHSIKQAIRRLGITGYTEATIASYAGTTSKGTGHQGLETAIAKIAKQEGIKLQVTWKNFSDLGTTTKERYRKYGDLMTDPDKAVFHHELYRNKYGHYSILKQVNTEKNTLIVANSLGNKCKAPAYCGYMENRSFDVQTSYLRGISQKSICIITREA